MNSPLEEFHRTARLVPRSKFQLLFDALRYTRYLTAMYQVVFQPDSFMAKSVSPIKEFTKVCNGAKLDLNLNQLHCRAQACCLQFIRDMNDIQGDWLRSLIKV